MVVIKDVTDDKKLFKVFVDFPNKLYKGNPWYTPFMRGDELHLFKKDNPVYEDAEARYFLAFKDGKPAGRIAAVIHRRYNEKVGEKRVRFSRLDFIEDSEVVGALLSAVENFAREKGMDIVHGPFGFNDVDREGYLTAGFDQGATVTETYNHEYYDRLIKEQGYEKECGWLEFNISVPPPEHPGVARVLRISEMVLQRYELRFAKYRTIKQIIKERSQEFFDIYFEAYGQLPGFVPFSDEIKKQMMTTFRVLLRPEFVQLVVDKNDRLIGFGLCFPDITPYLRKSAGRLTPRAVLGMLREKNRPKTKMELGLIGVRDEWRNKGVNAIIIAYALRVMHGYGVKELETNLNAETNNKIIAMWDGFDKRQHKRRISVFKRITGEKDGAAGGADTPAGASAPPEPETQT